MFIEIKSRHGSLYVNDAHILSIEDYEDEAVEITDTRSKIRLINGSIVFSYESKDQIATRLGDGVVLSPIF